MSFIYISFFLSFFLPILGVFWASFHFRWWWWKWWSLLLLNPLHCVGTDLEICSSQGWWDRCASFPPRARRSSGFWTTKASSLWRDTQRRSGKCWESTQRWVRTGRSGRALGGFLSTASATSKCGPEFRPLRHSFWNAWSRGIPRNLLAFAKRLRVWVPISSPECISLPLHICLLHICNHLIVIICRCMKEICSISSCSNLISSITWTSSTFHSVDFSYSCHFQWLCMNFTHPWHSLLILTHSSPVCAVGLQRCCTIPSRITTHVWRSERFIARGLLYLDGGTFRTSHRPSRNELPKSIGGTTLLTFPFCSCSSNCSSSLCFAIYVVETHGALIMIRTWEEWGKKFWTLK